MSAARSWIRIYTELLDDPRIQTLPGELFKLMVDLWLLAGRNDGCCGTVEEIAWALHSTDKAISTLLDTLISKTPKPLFVRDDIGRYFPRTWDRRQFTNDVSNQRVKAFRDRKKQAVTQAVTETVPDEADVTPRARAQSRVETETVSHSSKLSDTEQKQRHGGGGRKGFSSVGEILDAKKTTTPPPNSPKPLWGASSDLLRQWMHEFRPDWPIPDDDIVSESVAACNGANEQQILECLRFMHRNGKTPGKSWGFFPAMLRKYFHGAAS